MNKTVVTIVVILVVIVGFILTLQSPSFNKELRLIPTESVKKVSNPSLNDSTGENIQHSDFEYAPMVPYSESAVQKAATNGKAVLFFHAAWCPTCRSATADIQKNADKIPGDLTIIHVDYDTQNKLKNRYNVTYQHTFVQVDADGQELKKWQHGDLDDILKNVQ